MPAHPDVHLQKDGPSSVTRGGHQVDKGDGTVGGEEGKGEGGKREEGGGGEILVEKRTGGPNKGSTRGLRGPKNTKERVALEKKLYYV